MAHFMLTALVLLAIATATVLASDPELTMDFSVPPGVNISLLDGSFFTFKRAEAGVNVALVAGQLAAMKVFNNAFAALNALGISGTVLTFTPGSINPLHTQPRDTELLFLISGYLSVGVTDTTNKLYEANLTAGKSTFVNTEV